MKQQISFLKKVIIGFVVNMLMILAGLLTALDTVIQVLMDILETIVEMVRSFALIGSLLLIIFYIFTNDPHFDSVKRGFGIFAVIILGGGTLFVLSAFAPLVTGILEMLLAILRPQKLIDVLSLCAMNLTETYESMIRDNPDPWGLYIGLPVLIMDGGGRILRFLVSTAAVLGLPILTGKWGYSLNFGEGMSPERFGFEWWIAAALAVLCAIYGLRLGCLVRSSLYSYSKCEETQ